MPWAKGTVVKESKGFVFLAGTEGTKPESSDTAMYEKEGDVFVKQAIAEGAEVQTRIALEKIKTSLEEMGSSLDNIVKMTCYVVGDPGFPNGVANSPTWVKAQKAMNEFFQEHCPDLCWDKNPPCMDLIGVAGLAVKEMLIEIAAIAVLSDT